MLNLDTADKRRILDLRDQVKEEYKKAFDDGCMAMHTLAEDSSSAHTIFLAPLMHRYTRAIKTTLEASGVADPSDTARAITDIYVNLATSTPEHSPTAEARPSPTSANRR